MSKYCNNSRTSFVSTHTGCLFRFHGGLQKGSLLLLLPLHSAFALSALYKLHGRVRHQTSQSVLVYSEMRHHSSDPAILSDFQLPTQTLNREAKTPNQSVSQPVDRQLNRKSQNPPLQSGVGDFFFCTKPEHWPSAACSPGCLSLINHHHQCAAFPRIQGHLCHVIPHSHLSRHRPSP